jgi:hypothetical protein
MTTINGLAVPDDQVARLTAELHKQAVEGPHPRISGDIAERLVGGGDINLTGEGALATIEAITAAGVDAGDLLDRLRDTVGGVGDEAL